MTPPPPPSPDPALDPADQSFSGPGELGRAIPPRLAWRVASTVLALALAALLGPGFARSLRPSEGTVLDFYKEWSSVQNLRTGRPVYASQRDTVLEYLDVRLPEGDEFLFSEEYNTHPPAAVLLAIPFGRLSYSDAQFAWNLVGLAAFFTSLWLIVRELKIRVSAWGVAIFLSLLLVCDPFRQTINQGQVNFVLLLLIVLAWIADRRGRAWGAGLCVAAAACVKLYPALFFFLFAARRDWRTLAWGIGGGLGITLFTAAVLGPQAYLDYLGKPLSALQPFTNEWGNVSLLAFWQRLFGPPRENLVLLFESERLGKLLAALSAGALLAVLGRVAWRAETRDERDFAFAATATAMLLLTPIAWQHYFVLLSLPLLLFATRVDRGAPAWLLLGGIAAVLWCSIRLTWVAAGLTAGDGSVVSAAYPIHSLTALSLQFYAVLGVFVMLVFVPGDRRTAAPDASGRNP
ncbi:MAG: glycosyltransferase family 87 protein [Planctomycetales bacterium]